MARNHKFFFDAERVPRARGPAAEKILMNFLETDVQGSDHICHDLMDDLVAIEDGSDDSREFIGNAHRVTIDNDGVLIEVLAGGDAKAPEATEDGADEASSGAVPSDAVPSGAVPSDAVPSDGASEAATAETSATGAGAVDPAASYRTGLKHFREVLEDWEAFILDDELDDESLLDDDFA